MMNYFPVLHNERDSSGNFFFLYQGLNALIDRRNALRSCAYGYNQQREYQR